MIISPWGAVLGEATSAGLEVLVAELDLAEARERREQIDTLRLRRPSLYGGAVARNNLTVD
jgi:predicted amidohydrolase